MHKITAALLLVASFNIHAAPFDKGDAKAGKQLFDKSNCNRCHIAMMGGDGSAIFTRPDHKVRNPQQLIAQLRVCSANAGVAMSEQDEQNLAAYLNQSYYKFK